MEINDIAEAKRLRDRLSTKHDRLAQYRMIRDREMDGVLNSIKQILPERVKAMFMPVQSQEPDDEVQARKHVLASNQAEIEVVSRVKNPKTLKLAATFEEGLEALHEALFPIDVQLDECDGFLADGKTILAADYLGPGPELARYAGREQLEMAAEEFLRTGQMPGAQPEPGENGEPDFSAVPGVVDEEDDSPEACYVRAFLEAKGDHQKAYDQVTRDAMIADGLRVRLRVVDTDTWDEFLDVDGVNVGMEDGEIEIHPALRTLEAYGVREVNGKFVLTKDHKPSGDAGDEADPAFGVQPGGLSASGGYLSVDADNRIRFTQIRTREQIIIIADHPGGSDDTAGEGIFVTIDSPFDDHTGYVVIEGDTKLRAGEKRCQPVILGLLEVHQRLNMLKSAALAMTIEEASRDVYQPQSTAGVQPVDSTEDVKGQQVENGQAVPQIPEAKRVETTGIDLAHIIELTDGETQRFKMHESFTGIGESSETGIHLARVLTSYAMRLQPYQTKRAVAHKEVLSVIGGLAIKNRISVFVPFMPKESRALGEGIRVSEPRELTPQMFGMPVDTRVTIGAESDETRFAAEQISQTRTSFGAQAMTQHMQNIGTKDVQAAVAQILEDNIVFDAVGGEGRAGWLIPFVRQSAEEQLAAYIAALLPAPPAPPPTVPPGPPGGEQPPGGAPPPEDPNANAAGPAYVPPPTQTLPGGTPVTAGLGGASV